MSSNIDNYQSPETVVITYEGDYDTNLQLYVENASTEVAIAVSPVAFDSSVTPPVAILQDEDLEKATYLYKIVHTNALGRKEVLYTYQFNYGKTVGSSFYSRQVELRDVLQAWLTDPDTANTQSLGTRERNIMLADKPSAQKALREIETIIAAIDASNRQGGGIPSISL